MPLSTKCRRISIWWYCYSFLRNSQHILPAVPKISMTHIFILGYINIASVQILPLKENMCFCHSTIGWEYKYISSLQTVGWSLQTAFHWSDQFSAHIQWGTTNQSPIHTFYFRIKDSVTHLLQYLMDHNFLWMRWWCWQDKQSTHWQAFWIAEIM